MKKYEVDFANFYGGSFKRFYFYRSALKHYNLNKHKAYRVTLKKNGKQLLTQINENLRPDYFK